MTAFRTRLVLSILLLLLSALIAGCRSTDGYWTAPLTRFVTPKIFTGRAPATSGGSSLVGALAGIAISFIFMYTIVPVFLMAADVILLPVTVPHDIWLSYNRKPMATEENQVPVKKAGK